MKELARFHPRIQTAKGYLPVAQQRALVGQEYTTFRTLVKRLAGGRLVSERELRVIAQMAAQRALPNPAAKGKSSQLRKVVLSTKGMDHRKRTLCLINYFFQSSPHNHNLVFSNGARASLRISQAGHLLWDPNFIGPVVRAIVIPHTTNEAIRQQLAKVHKPRDVIGVEGSIGYLAGNIQLLEKSKKPVFVVWSRQLREMPRLPKEFQREYKRWDVEAMHALENIVRQIGIKQMLVVTPQMVSAFSSLGEEERIQKQYLEFGARLQRRGYVQAAAKLELTEDRVRNAVLNEQQKGDLGLGIADYLKQISSSPFFVKNL
jgi:hypothetical protein